MVAVATPTAPDRDRVTFSVTMDRSLHDRIAEVVRAINESGAGVATNRIRLIEDILRGRTTLEQLEDTWVRKTR